MKTFVYAAVLTVLVAGPATAQSMSQPETPSDRYTRERPDDSDDQQAQTREQRKSGEIETLRRDHMSSPNVKGQRVPEDTETGVPEAQQQGRAKQSEGGIRP